MLDKKEISEIKRGIQIANSIAKRNRLKVREPQIVLFSCKCNCFSINVINDNISQSGFYNRQRLLKDPVTKELVSREYFNKIQNNKWRKFKPEDIKSYTPYVFKSDDNRIEIAQENCGNLYTKCFKKLSFQPAFWKYATYEESRLYFENWSKPEY